MSEQTLQLALAVVVVVAAATDAMRQRVPNWLVMPATVLALCMRHALGGMESVLWGVVGWGTGFALMIGFYARGGMGAGDVKLVAAVGAFTGAQRILWISAYTGVLGGVYAVGIVIYSLVARAGWVRAGRELRQTGESLLLSGAKVESLAESLRGYPKLRYAIVVALGVGIEQVFGIPRY
jgi:prepilin peptidase CpaA